MTEAAQQRAAEKKKQLGAERAKHHKIFGTSVKMLFWVLSLLATVWITGAWPMVAVVLVALLLILVGFIGLAIGVLAEKAHRLEKEIAKQDHFEQMLARDARAQAKRRE